MDSKGGAAATSKLKYHADVAVGKTGRIDLSHEKPEQQREINKIDEMVKDEVNAKKQKQMKESDFKAPVFRNDANPDLKGAIMPMYSRTNNKLIKLSTMQQIEII